MIGLRFITTVIFQTFHISWLLLFTVPWTCPVVGKNTTKALVYFPERGVSCLPAQLAGLCTFVRAIIKFC